MLAASRSVKEEPWTSFYPCRYETGHPILYSLEAQKLLRSGPIYTSVPIRETRMKKRAAHTNAQKKGTCTSTHTAPVVRCRGVQLSR